MRAQCQIYSYIRCDKLEYICSIKTEECINCFCCTKMLFSSVKDLYVCVAAYQELVEKVELEKLVNCHFWSRLEC